MFASFSRKRDFAKHALRRGSRIDMQANPWDADRGLGMKVLARTAECLAITLTPAPLPLAGEGCWTPFPKSFTDL